MILLLTLATLSIACKSAPPPADTEGFTVLQMMQRAQDRSEARDWAGAAAWYEATKLKFADDLNTVTSCRYELAFLAYKSGKYAEARAQFEALIADYSGENGPKMPQHLLTLSRKVLATMAEKTGK